ncbi:MAG: PEP-CTERM sorting domain-containing protein [Verrucomicrobiaceae bacterium]|nr:MAG: PEP-CTERM sorting domain-containing protein [Verrucomicrobiaceae bacterium]
MGVPELLTAVSQGRCRKIISRTTTTGSTFREYKSAFLSYPNTDIILFQLTSSPPLPDLSIRASTPIAGDSVVMIGNGVSQDAARSSWNVAQGPNENDDVWTPSPGGAVETFGSPGGQAIRWGMNNVEDFADVDDDFGTVRSLVTVFNDDLVNRPDEAQAVLGDSGSGVFLKNGSDWELAGMIFAVGTLDNYDNIPGGVTTSILDSSVTYAADLSFYRTQILSVIPEPGTTTLMGAALLGLLRRRR